LWYPGPTGRAARVFIGWSRTGRQRWLRSFSLRQLYSSFNVAFHRDRQGGTIRRLSARLIYSAGRNVECGPIALMTKRPRSLNQPVKSILDTAIEEKPVHEPPPKRQGKDPVAVRRGRLGGLKGGKARAAAMSPEERRAAGIKAGSARWNKQQP
jgi:hypothetical protein